MKFLVLGCNGMAGHMVSLYLKERGHAVTGFARSRLGLVDTILGDALDGDCLADIIREGRYGCVVNCIGILNRSAEDDRPRAVYLNSYLPHFLADITDGMDTQIVHISTDCVFSGRRGQYTEDDIRDGETFYDRSKALGEIENDKDFTIRTSIIGPDMNPDGIGLLNWFLGQKGKVQGYAGVIWTGMTTLQLAKTIETVSGEKAHGLCNIVPRQPISKYDLLLLCRKYLRKDDVEIVRTEIPIADKSLKSTRPGYCFDIPGHGEMLEELASWMTRHKELYPHYGILEA